MNDRIKTVQELGQEYLDAQWDCEKHRLDLRDTLELGEDDLASMLYGREPGDMLAKVGGMTGMLEIALDISKLQARVDETFDAYIKARRFVEATASAEMHADVEDARINVEDYIGRKHGEPGTVGQRIDAGRASDEAVSTRRGEAADPTASSRSHELRGPAIDLTEE